MTTTHMASRSFHIALSMVLLTAMLALMALPVNVHAADTNQNNDAVLLFSIGMHIEPFGAVISKKVPMLGRAKDIQNNRIDYNQKSTYERGLKDIQSVVDIVDKHNGKMIIQTQTPFTSMVIKYNPTLFSGYEKSGHEIGLHFHEDTHLGRYCENLSPEVWAAVMTEEIDLIKQAGATSVRYWSGGNLYPDVLEAADMAGLEVMSDYKNRNTQKSDDKLLGINPWRPAGGPENGDVAEFAKHDPNGEIIYLPEGKYPEANYTSIKRSLKTNDDSAYFNYLKDSLIASVKAARTDRVNVFHFTIHPGEYVGSRSEPFAEIDKFLSQVIDPLVLEGKVKWATFSQMADAYKAWETANPGADPRGISARTPVLPAISGLMNPKGRVPRAEPVGE